MFKQGEKCSYKRATFIQRQRNIKKDGAGEGDWILEKGKEEKVEGVIANLSSFHLPVTLEDKTVKTVPYAQLTFGKGNKASFGSKLPDRHKIINGEEKDVIGKAITITGKLLNVRELTVPILVGNELRHIPWKELTFPKDTK